MVHCDLTWRSPDVTVRSWKSKGKAETGGIDQIGGLDITQAEARDSETEFKVSLGYYMKTPSQEKKK